MERRYGCRLLDWPFSQPIIKLHRVIVESFRIANRMFIPKTCTRTRGPWLGWLMTKASLNCANQFKVLTLTLTTLPPPHNIYSMMKRYSLEGHWSVPDWLRLHNAYSTIENFISWWAWSVRGWLQLAFIPWWNIFILKGVASFRTTPPHLQGMWDHSAPSYSNTKEGNLFWKNGFPCCSAVHENWCQGASKLFLWINLFLDTL